MGNYQLGPDGSVQYEIIPAWMGSVVVSNGATTVNGYVIPRGMQIWTVSVSAFYEIVAGGASGGSFINTNYNFTAGRGVVIKTRHYLQSGTVVIVLVGMRPPACWMTKWSGGGGGTFVSIYSATDLFSLKTQHTLLLVAGGGGGHMINFPHTARDASLNSSGTKCTFDPPTTAAINGGGGGGYGKDGGNASDGVAAPSNKWDGAGGGGAGFIGNGGYVNSRLSWRAMSFLNGGTGAQCTQQRSSTVCESGSIRNLDPIDRTLYFASAFGGGGEGCGISGGGGGGYSGGQGCEPNNGMSGPQPIGGGGGGGSYDINNANLVPYNPWNQGFFGPPPSSFKNGYMLMHGIVVVSFCPPGKYESPVSGCVSCPVCSAGFYSIGCGGTNSGRCEGCTNTEYSIQ